MTRRETTAVQGNSRTANRRTKAHPAVHELAMGDFVLHRATWYPILGLDADHVTIPKTGHPGRTVSLYRGQVLRICTAAAMRQAVAAERARNAGRA